MTKGRKMKTAKSARFPAEYESKRKERKRSKKRDTAIKNISKDDNWNDFVKEMQEFETISQSMRAVREHAHHLWACESYAIKMATGFVLQSNDLASLKDGCHVSDEIMFAYLDLLSKQHSGTFSFSTYFYPVYEQQGYNYVKRWTEKFDIFSFNVLLIPIPMGDHWTLCSVDIPRMTVLYFDSLGGSEEPAKKVLTFLSIEYFFRKHSNLPIEWKVLTPIISKQLDRYDGGIFACQFAKNIVKRKPPLISPHLISYFRRQMICELTSSQILNCV